MELGSGQIENMLGSESTAEFQINLSEQGMKSSQISSVLNESQNFPRISSFTSEDEQQQISTNDIKDNTNNSDNMREMEKQFQQMDSERPEDMWSIKFEQRIICFLERKNINWVPADEICKLRTQSTPLSICQFKKLSVLSGSKKENLIMPSLIQRRNLKGININSKFTGLTLLQGNCNTKQEYNNNVIYLQNTT